MKNLIISLVLFLISITITVGQTATLSVSAKEPVNPESMVNFQVTCQEIDDEIATFQWVFLYDSLKLTPVNVVNYHEDFPELEWLNNMDYGPNMIILTWLSNEARNRTLNTGEVICELQFEYSGGETELKWARADDVTEGDKKVLTAMWTEQGIAYYLKFINAIIGTE